MERLSGSVCGVRIVHVVELARARATNICSVDSAMYRYLKKNFENSF